MCHLLQNTIISKVKMWAPPDAKVSNTISNHQNNILLVCYLVFLGFFFLKTVFCFSEILNRCSDSSEFSEKLDCGLFDRFV